VKGDDAPVYDARDGERDGEQDGDAPDGGGSGDGLPDDAVAAAAAADDGPVPQHNRSATGRPTQPIRTSSCCDFCSLKFDKKLLRKIIFCLITVNVCTFRPSVVKCKLGSAQFMHYFGRPCKFDA
jgi:hypothetical protein